MTTITRTETRRRGIIGRIFLWLFWLFNALMLVWMVGGLGAAGDVAGSASTEAEKAGAAIGTAIGATLILGIWMAGAVILGLLVLLTPGKTVVTETRAD